MTDNPGLLGRITDELARQRTQQQKTEARREIAQAARSVIYQALADLPTPAEALQGFVYFVPEGITAQGDVVGVLVYCTGDGLGGWEWKRVHDDLPTSATPVVKMDVDSLAFYGTAPITKPTVTGAHASNTALMSLLTALANLGLITNNTTP